MSQLSHINCPLQTSNEEGVVQLLLGLSPILSFMIEGTRHEATPSMVIFSFVDSHFRAFDHRLVTVVLM